MEARAGTPAGSLARTAALGAAVGAVVGFVVWSLGGPAVISWWYEPPSRDAFSCAGSVKQALSQFVAMQLVSAGIGAVVIGIAVFLVRRKQSSSAPKAPLAP